MKICHITSAHDREDTRIFYKECVTLAKTGYDVYFVVSGTNDYKYGVHIIGAGEPPKLRLKRMICFARKVYNIARLLDCDVYQIHDPELLPYALMLKKMKKHVVFDSHENYGSQISRKQYLLKPLREVIGIAYKLYETYVCRRIDTVISVCTIKGNMIFEGRAKQEVLLPNYPLLNPFDYEYIDTTNEFTAIYIGALSPARGITNAVLACYKAGVKLILCGRFFSEEYKKQLQLMKEYKCVEYVGKVSPTEIHKYICRADVGLATLMDVGQYSEADTYGTKVLEYFLMKKPVILSDTVFYRTENAKHKFGICVDPNNVDAMARIVDYMSRNRGLIKKMGINGYNLVVNELNWEKVKKALVELYISFEKSQ